MRLTALPPHIPLHTAAAVLFVGKAARVLRDPGIRGGGAGSGNQRLPQSGAACSGGTTGGAVGSSSGGAGGRGSGGGSQLQQQAGCEAAWRPDVDGLETAQALQRLAAQPAFDGLAFQSAVEGSRKQVIPG